MIEREAGSTTNTSWLTDRAAVVGLSGLHSPSLTS